MSCDRQHKKLKKTKHKLELTQNKLEMLNNSLEKKVLEEVEKNRKKDEILSHQSKLAAMGEMINNIAHQWKQPLTHLGYINMNLQLASTDEVFDKVYLNKKIIESNEQIDFMTNTKTSK